MAKLSFELPICRLRQAITVLDHMINLTEEWLLIRDAMIIVCILMINQAKSAAPERSLSLTRRNKTLAMSSHVTRRFNVLNHLQITKLEF